MSYLLEALEEIENPRVKFTANIRLAADLPPPPDDISFNVPYGPHFETLEEGYINLGKIPNPEEFDVPFEVDWEECLVKYIGSNDILLPEGTERLRPALEIAAAFDRAHSPNFERKSCTIILRDHFHYQDKPAEEIHRDPPKPTIGQAQNVYAFVSSHPTEFPDHETPEPFDLICFTAASPHRKPAILLSDSGEPIRRVFCAFAFDYNPENQPVSMGDIVTKVGRFLLGRRDQPACHRT